VVAGEAAAWDASGVIVGPVLSLATSLVLVHVVDTEPLTRQSKNIRFQGPPPEDSERASAAYAGFRLSVL
jgi:hypothetical protein